MWRTRPSGDHALNIVLEKFRAARAAVEKLISKNRHKANHLTGADVRFTANAR